MNYNCKINLSRLTGTRVGKIDGKKYICIPLNGGQLFSGTAGVYLTCTAWQQDTNQYGDTHYLKPQMNKSEYEQLSIEERRAIPIIGSLKPIEGEWQRTQKSTEIVTDEDPDIDDPNAEGIPF